MVGIFNPFTGRPSQIASEVLSTTDNNSISLKVNDMKNSAFSLQNFGGRVVLKTHFGMRVEYVASNWGLDIFIPDCYQDLMPGFEKTCLMAYALKFRGIIYLREIHNFLV